MGGVMAKVAAGDRVAFFHQGTREWVCGVVRCLSLKGTRAFVILDLPLLDSGLKSACVLLAELRIEGGGETADSGQGYI